MLPPAPLFFSRQDRRICNSHTRVQEHFEKLRKAYPGRKLLVVSNTSGATSWDKNLAQAAAVEESTGVHVLPHAVKKPGCGPEIMAYFRQHPETGVTDASQVAVVGDRLTTDMMLANMMGGWGFWIRDGVVPLRQKSMVCSRGGVLPKGDYIFANER